MRGFLVTLCSIQSKSERKVSFFQVHHSVSTGQHRGCVSFGTRQNTGKVELGSSQFGFVVVFFRSTVSQCFLSHLGHLRPQVSQRHVARVHQVVYRSRTDFFTVLHRGHTNLHGQVAPLFVQFSQRLHQVSQFGVGFFSLAELVYQLGEVTQGSTLSHQHFTAQQVECLNTGSTFIDTGNLGVTHQLFHAPLSDKAVTTEYLYTQVSGFVTNFGQEGFGNRSQEAQHFVSGFTRFFVFRLLNNVVLLCSQLYQRTATFSEGFLRQQHTTDIRVHDDRVSGFFLRFRASLTTDGQTVFGVRQSALVRGFSGSRTLQRGTDTGGVHKGEHAVQTFVFRSDQPAFGTVEVHHTGGVTVDTHFVFDRTTDQAVALTRSTVFVRQELRHDKQRDTLGTFRSTRQTGQYDVDDVIGHVVFTGRDEDFAASNGIRTVSVRLGFGFQDTQVRTAMGFGQTHGTGPLTRHQLAQVDVFLFVSTVQFDGVHRAVGQTRVHTPGPVGRTHHFRHNNAQRFRQTLTTVVNFMSQ